MLPAACLIAVLAFNATFAYAQAPFPPAGPPQSGMPRDTQTHQQAVGTAVMSGHVFAGDSGRPLRRALVRAVSNDPREGRTVSTDADGRWELKQLPAGRYTITVSKGGFVGLSYGQRRPFEQGKPVELAEGQRLDKLDIVLPRGSAITGRIVDEYGEPLAGIRVSAMRYQYFSGIRRLMNAPGVGASDMTDDIGQFRLHGLSPGDYYVVASLGVMVSLQKSDDRTGYAPTYYPGTPSIAEAQRVTVGEGQEVASIGFALEPVRIATISGTATSSQGKPLANDVIMVSSPSMTAGGGLTSVTMIKPDGSFTVSNLAPGDYVLQSVSRNDLEALAASGRSTSMRIGEVARVPVTVNGADVTGVTLVTGPTATARGRIVFEGGPSAGVSAGTVTVMALPSSMDTMPVGGASHVRDDWTFELVGLFGKRTIRAIPPPGWFLKCITLNGTDISDSPLDFKAGEETTGLEITFTRTMATVSGTVQTSKGQPTTDCVVVVFASDSTKWGWQTRFVRAVRPDQAGKYFANGLPAADYLAVALPYLEPGEESDPEVLERLRPLATPVALDEGESKALNLKMK